MQQRGTWAWWADLGRLPYTHRDTLSLPLSSRSGKESKVKKLTGGDIGREVTNQPPENRLDLSLKRDDET